VAIEMPVNVVLTVWFVLELGAIGAALATLATVLLMDFVVFPIVGGPEFANPVVGTVFRHGVVPAALGAVSAVAAAAVAATAGAAVVRLTVGGVLSGVIAAGAGLVLLGPSGRATLRTAVAARRGAPAEVAPVAL
jgi:hypothetical protein